MKRLFRRIGMGLAIIAAVVLLLAVGIYFRSQSLVNRVYPAPTDVIAISTDAAALARGKHLVNHVSVCVDCHGVNLEGGTVVDEPVFMRLTAPNLTTGQGGIGDERSDADLLRVLRYGILPDGRSVKLMPSDDYQHLSDADLVAIIAYIRSVPPQDQQVPASALGPAGRLLLAFGQLPLLIAERVNPQLAHPATVEAAVSVAYGGYLADIAGCTGCHGPGLSGGPIPLAPPEWPPSANLTPGGDVGQWDETDFINTIRTGINPAGKTLDQTMPWFRYRDMGDEELQALWRFLQSVPAQPFGNR